MFLGNFRDSFQGLLGPKKEEGIVAEAAEYCPSLTYKQRLYGFGICLAVAFLCGIVSSILLFVARSMIGFAIVYSISNVFGIGSSFFLVGPKAQIKKMFKPVRVWAAVLFLVLIALTVVAAIVIQNPGLVLLFVILQYCALFWYTLSYIPGARTCFLGCCKKTVGLETD